MKFLSTCLLAALAACLLALTMTVGAASATVLCKTNTNPCTEKYGTGTEINSSLAEGEWVLKSSFLGEVKCKESTLNSVVENAGGVGTSVSGSVSTLTMGGCNGTVVVAKKGSMTHHWIPGTVDSTTTWVSGELTVEYLGLHCLFSSGAAVDLGRTTVRRFWFDTFDWNPNLPRTGGRSGVFCGSSAIGQATYAVSSPSPAYWKES